MPRAKRKMARPNVLTGPVKIAFWVERGTFQKAKGGAALKGVSVSEVVRAAITAEEALRLARRVVGRDD